MCRVGVPPSRSDDMLVCSHTYCVGLQSGPVRCLEAFVLGGGLGTGRWAQGRGRKQKQK